MKFQKLDLLLYLTLKQTLLVMSFAPKGRKEERKEGRKKGRTDEGRKKGQKEGTFTLTAELRSEEGRKEGRKEGRTDEGPGRTTGRLKSLYLLVHVVCLRVNDFILLSK